MQTVVGVFDSAQEAEHARSALMTAGFSDSDVRVQSQSAMQGTSTTGHAATNKDEGFMSSVSNFFSELFGGEESHAGNYSEAVRRGSTVVTVMVDDDDQVEDARATLAAAGAVDIDKRAEGWRSEGYSGFDATAKPFGAEEVQAERMRYPQADSSVQRTAAMGDTVLPIVREELEVGKREVDLGAVRVFSRTETRPVQEQVELREQHADIARRTVDRPASEADLKAFSGGSVEVREMAERAVVSKTARVVEEVVVGTQSSTRTETVSDELRNTVVEVEKTPVSGTAAMAGTGTMPDYRSHYQTNQAMMGGSYEDHEPAYSYGSTLRADSRYTNRPWSEIEGDAQRDWTSRNPNSTWESAKAAVRHGWESVTGQR